MSAASPRPRSRMLGRYELVELLGRGGMGAVYLARAKGPHGFEPWFAVKTIHPHLSNDPVFRTLFVDEARISASLRHPGVAQVFELGEVDGEYYLVLEYLEGESLATWLEVRADRGDGPLPPALAAFIGARVAEGLHHAHEAKDAEGRPLGIVHRDVSPQNVMVTLDGEVKITDFGIARARDRLATTGRGSWLGKLAYAAPEQLADGAIDRRADVLALGVVLWEATTGERLFATDSDLTTMRRIVEGYRLAPSEVMSGYPQELERIVMRALAHDPDERYPDMRVLADELDTFARENGAHLADLRREIRQTLGERIAARAALSSGALGAATTANATPEGVSREIGSEGTRSVLRRFAGQSKRAALLAGTAVLSLLALGVAVVAGGLSVRAPDAAAAPTAQPDPAITAAPLETALGSEVDSAGAAVFAAEPDAGLVAVAGGLVELDASQVETPEPGPTVPEREARPRRGSARLTLITRPWARVWINGRPFGETPFADRVVPAGRLRVVLRAEGTGAPREIVLEAAPGERLHQNLAL